MSKIPFQTCTLIAFSFPADPIKLFFPKLGSTMLLSLLTTVTLALTVSASKLFVSSYAGSVVTLDLKGGNGSYSLQPIQNSPACAPNATWLELDTIHDILYCIEENIVSSNGSLHSFKFDRASGILTHLSNLTIPQAPVHATIYTNPQGAQLLAVAHYAHALTTYKLSQDGHFTPFQQFDFTMPKPGPNPERQEAPHPHQVIVDPSAQYFVVPDLGADLLRIFCIDAQTLRIDPRKPFELPPGSGPRHGSFLSAFKPRKNESSEYWRLDYYFVVTELTNTLYAYNVMDQLKTGGLTFNPLGDIKTYGDNKDPALPSGFASEVITRQPYHIIVANRQAPIFELTNPDPKNTTKIPSDTLATFTYDPKSESVKFDALTPAGGVNPRSFAVNRDGSLVAVPLQDTGRVAIYQRCEETGKINDTALAVFDGIPTVTSIVWLE